MSAPDPRPLVSVLLPVRDGGAYLRPALASILDQRGVSLEVIAIDDGSRDGSGHLLRETAARDARVRLLPGPERGIAQVLNLGLGQARGTYIARMDADDIALPGRLAAQATYLERHPEVGVLGSQALSIDALGHPSRPVRVPVGAAQVRAALDTSSPLIHPAVMMRRDLVLQVGGYRSLFEPAEDYDLWLRLAVLTELDNLKDSYLLYRRHPVQQSRRRAYQQARASALALYMAQRQRQGRTDPCSGWPGLAGWQSQLAQQEPDAILRIRRLTAASLVDNGGTLRGSGGRYWHLIRRGAAVQTDPELRRRLALAAVRHQLQLARAGRLGEAVWSLVTDMVYWRSTLLFAVLRHGRGY